MKHCTYAGAKSEGGEEFTRGGNAFQVKGAVCAKGQNYSREGTIHVKGQSSKMAQD
jgi:hypothetical protein